MKTARTNKPNKKQFPGPEQQARVENVLCELGGVFSDLSAEYFDWGASGSVNYYDSKLQKKYWDGCKAMKKAADHVSKAQKLVSAALKGRSGR